VIVQIDSAGYWWLLVTTRGGHDPVGKWGSVHPELGGSGCRWFLLP
jgi:hypothetical protein